MEFVDSNSEQSYLLLAPCCTQQSLATKQTHITCDLTEVIAAVLARLARQLHIFSHRVD